MGRSARHPASSHQPKNADSSVSLKTCSALQPLNQNLAAVNTSSRIHYSVSGKSNYLFEGGGELTALQKRQSNCKAILEEQIALSKYTDSLQRRGGEYESHILSFDSTRHPPHLFPASNSQFTKCGRNRVIH